MSKTVQDYLEDYKNGKHIHLGDPREDKSREEANKLDIEIVDAIYAYEMSIGGIKNENGSLVFSPEVLERLPKYRDDTTITCCLEN